MVKLHRLPTVASFLACSTFFMSACAQPDTSTPSSTGGHTAEQAEAEALGVGDEAPDFTLPDASGEDVVLSDLLADGPVVLVWYRGGWCPYCNRNLAAFQEHLDDIQAAGAHLVAISPELPDHTAETVDKNELDFIVLSDVGNDVAEAYGLVFTLDDETHANYQGWFDLHAVNGDDTGTLPVPATYVVDQDGTITWAFVEADYRERADPQAVVEALNELP